MRLCVSACPRSDRKTAQAINTKVLVMYTLYPLGMHWPRGQKVKVTRSRKPPRRTVPSDNGRQLCCVFLCQHGYTRRYDCVCFLVLLCINYCNSNNSFSTIFNSMNSTSYQAPLLLLTEPDMNKVIRHCTRTRAQSYSLVGSGDELQLTLPATKLPVCSDQIMTRS